MTIWVDADACPGVIKDSLYRAAQRASLQVTLVANRALQVPRSPWISMVQVPRGFDVADNHIVEVAVPGDLIITGTPAGVGWSRKPPRFMKPGDVCEVEIEGIGVLRNPVVQQG